MTDEAGIEVLEGDITRIEADAIVNAANAELAPGGEKLAAACRAIGGCATGSAVVTPAFDIDTARCIIHAVGPIYSQHAPDEARRLLRSAYAAAIGLAADQGCASIAFPAISTGIYGYPLDEACKEAVAVCRAEGPRTGLAIKLVAFDRRTADGLRAHLEG